MGARSDQAPTADPSDRPPLAEGERIPFNRAYTTGDEHVYIQQAIENLHLSGNGPFTERCTSWLEARTGAKRVLLTSSCTSALEMAVMLAGIGPGDEVIMPSFTFVSTASAVALRGGIPVFAEIREDSFNLDPESVADAVTPRTRAILPVHYAGVGCDMNELTRLSLAHDLTLIEDAAQGILARRDARPLGAFGQLGCLSFHETKNVTCGEGGALLINDEQLVERAEILQEKGTNRSKFFRGQVDKYTWVDLGSSFLTSEINAAFLWAQLEHADEITERRLAHWSRYHLAFGDLERSERLRRPIVPDRAEHNAHMYAILLPSREKRDRLIAALAAEGVMAVFHYVPLHSSPAGLRYGRAAGSLRVTEAVSDRLVRLPLWAGMTSVHIDRVVAAVAAAVA